MATIQLIGFWDIFFQWVNRKFQHEHYQQFISWYGICMYFSHLLPLKCQQQYRRPLFYYLRMRRPGLSLSILNGHCQCPLLLELKCWSILLLHCSSLCTIFISAAAVNHWEWTKLGTNPLYLNFLFQSIFYWFKNTSLFQSDSQYHFSFSSY